MAQHRCRKWHRSLEGRGSSLRGSWWSACRTAWPVTPELALICRIQRAFASQLGIHPREPRLLRCPRSRTQASPYGRSVLAAISSSRLYFATRSPRAGAPNLSPDVASGLQSVKDSFQGAEILRVFADVRVQNHPDAAALLCGQPHIFEGYRCGVEDAFLDQSVWASTLPNSSKRPSWYQRSRAVTSLPSVSRSLRTPAGCHRPADFTSTTVAS